MREVVLDTETTGLEYNEGHKIIEIACVELLNFVPTGKIFQKYINPEKNISESAEKIHGLTNDFLLKKEVFKEIVPDFTSFIKDAPLIIHNATFDMGFINNELKSNGLKIIKNSIIDTLIIARKKFPGSPANLDALCRRFNIDLTTREKHGALIDAKLTAQVYLELKGGQQPNLILDSKTEDKKENKIKDFGNEKLQERTFNLSEEEKDKHKEFLKKIKDPIWNQYN